MELNLFVKELFSKAQEEGFSEYEVYYVDRESLSISVYKEEVEKYNLNNSAGLSFRGKFGDRIGYSYTEILDEVITHWKEEGYSLKTLDYLTKNKDKN